jgi:nuclear transcription Y subunit beta
MDSNSLSISDKILPLANVSHILKKSLPEGIKISKDAKRAIAHAGTVFVMYITKISEEISQENQGKKKKALISPEHIIQALEEMEFRNISESCNKNINHKLN